MFCVMQSDFMASYRSSSSLAASINTSSSFCSCFYVSGLNSCLGLGAGVGVVTGAGAVEVPGAGVVAVVLLDLFNGKI